MSSIAIPSTRSVVNEIPFDILFLIFREYARNPSKLYNPEALLLVSRSWKEASLGTPLLWSTFYIPLRTASEAVQWLSRIKRWVPRMGDSDPITIYLADEWTESHEDTKIILVPQFCPMNGRRADKSDGQPICTCRQIIGDYIDPILEELAGMDGQHCTRWLSVDLRFHFASQQCHTLTYPMPNLEHLHIDLLGDFSIDPNMFITVPKLHDLTLGEAYFFKFFGEGVLTDSTALNLTKLTLINCMGSHMDGHPPSFPNVKELEVRGMFDFNNLADTEFPKLKVVTLDTEFPFILILATSAHFPIEQLVSLSLLGMISKGRSAFTREKEAARTIKSLLKRCQALENLTLERDSLLLFLRVMIHPEIVLVDHPLRLFVTGTVDGGSEAEDAVYSQYSLGTGEARREDVGRIARDNDVDDLHTFTFHDLWQRCVGGEYESDSD